MVRNLNFLRALPDFGAKLYETFRDVINAHETLAQQVNGNPTGQPSSPPSIQGLKVQAQNGHFQVAIQDTSPIFRDVHYYVEHADNPHFTNPHVIHNGHSRNLNIYLGNVTRYWRAYSAYASSAPGAPAYHGSQVQPLAVQGGGTNAGPAFLDSEGSGTGARGVGLSGPGPIPFRSSTGAAPSR